MKINYRGQVLISLIKLAEIGHLSGPQSISRKAASEDALIKLNRVNYVPETWAKKWLEKKPIDFDLNNLPIVNWETQIVRNDNNIRKAPTQPIEEPKIEQSKIEQPKVEQPEVEQSKIEEAKAEEPIQEIPSIKTIGKYVLVLIAIGMQAFVWSLIWIKMMLAVGHDVPFWLGLLFGAIVEASGFIVVSNLDRHKYRLEDERKKYIWLFFMIQVILELSFFGIFGSYSEWIGRTIISITIPFSLALYMRAFFKH